MTCNGKRFSQIGVFGQFSLFAQLVIRQDIIVNQTSFTPIILR